MPTFEVFDAQSAPRVKQPLVSLQRKGVFTLNRAAFIALGEPEAVHLLFDPHERVVGFSAADPGQLNTYAVRVTEPSGSYAISGVSFVKHYEIPVDVARRWPAKLDDGVLFFALDDPAVEVVGRDARQRLDAFGNARAARRRP